MKPFVALVGFMAAGKTTIGRHLATELGMPFVDLDAEIVAVHGPIPDLFAKHGEAGFRAFERDVVAAIFAREPAVIALGGGAVTHAPTRALVAQNALRIYLEVPPEVIVGRVRRSPTVRPLLGRSPTVARVRELLEARVAYYREAELTIRGARRSKRALAVEIAEAVRENRLNAAASPESARR